MTENNIQSTVLLYLVTVTPNDTIQVKTEEVSFALYRVGIFTQIKVIIQVLGQLGFMRNYFCYCFSKDQFLKL